MTPSHRHYKLTVLATIISATTHSATLLAEENSVDLDKLVVTAAGYEQEVASAPASVSVISREEIESQSYTDLTDALRNVPGVVVTGGGAGDGGVDISLRGMPANYTLLLVDGKRISSRESRPNGNAGYETDWLPPLDAIEQIEVVRGPMSTLYGSDAIGGVINIITRKVRSEWSGSIQQDVTFQENDDSGDYKQTSFNIAGPLIENYLGIQIYGRNYSRDEDNILNGYEDKDLNSLSTKLTFTPNSNHDFTLETGQTNQRRVSLMGKSAPTEDCGHNGCSDSNTKTVEDHFAISHTGRWDIGTTETFIQREKTDNQGRDISITNTSAKTSFVMPFDSQTFTVGANFEHAELNDQDSNTISDRTQIKSTQTAIFVEDEWYATDELSITGGARLDHDENFGDHISPRLYGVWQMSSDWILKGGVSGGFRSPTLREITSDWGQTSRGGNIYGNPDLKPETSISKEISLNYNGANQLNASFTIFHNDFKDKITRVTCPTTICTDGANTNGADPTYRINVDEAVTQGIEASITKGLTASLDINASYTFTHSEQKTGEYKGEPLTQLPKHLFSAGLNWQNTKKLNSWGRLTYRGEESQPNTGPSSSAIVAPSSTILDAGIVYKLTQEFTLKAGIYNLLDEEILYDEYGYVADGRRYSAAVNYVF